MTQSQHPRPSVHDNGTSVLYSLSFMSPYVRLLLAVALIIGAEISIMHFVETTEVIGTYGIWAEVLVDAALLLVFVLPVLHHLFYRPILFQVAAHRRKEEELRQIGDHLKGQVAKCTAELEECTSQYHTEAVERQRALEELRYSEGKYSTLVENAPTGIFVQRHGRMIFANRQLAEMTGYTRRELLAAAPDQLIHPDDRPWVQEIMQKRLAGEEVPEEYVARALTKAGETRWVLLRAVLVDYRGGRSTLGNVVDITAGKAAEDALAVSERDLKALSARLLTAQEDERAQIARDLHDGVGQSLTAIKFGVESALLHPERAEALEALVPRMQELISEVRRISVGLRPEILDNLGLVRTLSWQAKEFEALLPEMEVVARCDVEEDEVPGPLKIVVFRIVQEALNNVAKHSGAKRVNVLLQRAGGELELAIEDDGRGLPSRDAGSDAVGSGSGFGLSSMRERTELTGGRFSLVSQPGRGTVVRSVWTQQPPEDTG